MRYSLLSRFKGGLLGSIMVETLLHHSPNRKLSPWTRISMCAIESLISRGKLVRNNWLNQIGQDGQSLLEAKNTANSSQTAIATLPIALFCHENPSLLKQNLELSAAIWQDPSSPSEDVLVWGYTIALALAEKLNPSELIAQIIAYLGTDPTPLRQQLEMVQKFLDSQTGLEQVVTELSRQRNSSETSISIALALYCFLSTPEEVGLCLMRARLTGVQSHITTALTGALAGVYNSYNGIPVGWRNKILSHPKSRDICQRAELLFAVWAGVYESASTFHPRSLLVTSPSRMNSDGGKVALL